MVAVGVRMIVRVVQFDGDKIHGARAHPSFRADLVGETPDQRRLAPQHDRLKRVIVIEDHVAG